MEDSEETEAEKTSIRKLLSECNDRTNQRTMKVIGVIKMMIIKVNAGS
jgi:hypothetical protein